MILTWTVWSCSVRLLHIQLGKNKQSDIINWTAVWSTVCQWSMITTLRRWYIVYVNSTGSFGRLIDRMIAVVIFHQLLLVAGHWWLQVGHWSVASCWWMFNDSGWPGWLTAACVWGAVVFSKFTLLKVFLTTSMVSACSIVNLPLWGEVEWYDWDSSRVRKGSGNIFSFVGWFFYQGWSGFSTKGGDFRYQALTHVVKCNVQVCVYQLLGGVHLVVGCLLTGDINFIIWVEVCWFWPLYLVKWGSKS